MLLPTDPILSDSLNEWLKEYWKPFTYTVTTALLVSFAKRIWRLAKRLFGIEDAVVERPRADWPSGEIARTFQVGALRNGITVGPGTKLIVIDKGTQQFLLEPGPHGRGKIRKMLKQHGVDDSGIALQYITPAFDLESHLPSFSTSDGFDDVESIMKWSLRISDQSPEKILTWHLSRDGLVEEKEVAAVLADEVRSTMQQKLLSLKAKDLLAVPDQMREELEQLVNQRILADHGLAGRLRSISFNSEKFELEAKAWNEVKDEEQKAELRESIRRVLKISEAGELRYKNDIEELSRTLQHEGEMKIFARLKEKAETLEWFRRHAGGLLKEAFEQEIAFSESLRKTMTSKPSDNDSQRAYQEILSFIDRLRKAASPSNLQIQFMESGAASRDIVPQFRHSHSKRRIGDNVCFKVISDHSGYLSMFNVGTSGIVTLLYPNKFHVQSWIEANKVVAIPSAEDHFDLPLHGPEGTEIVQAFVTSRPIHISEVKLNKGEFFQEREPRVAARDIGVMARELDAMPPDSWAEASLSFEVS